MTRNVASKLFTPLVGGRDLIFLAYKTFPFSTFSQWSNRKSMSISGGFVKKQKKKKKVKRKEEQRGSMFCTGQMDGHARTWKLNASRANPEVKIPVKGSLITSWTEQSKREISDGINSQIGACFHSHRPLLSAQTIAARIVFGALLPPLSNAERSIKLANRLHKQNQLSYSAFRFNWWSFKSTNADIYLEDLTNWVLGNVNWFQDLGLVSKWHLVTVGRLLMILLLICIPKDSRHMIFYGTTRSIAKIIHLGNEGLNFELTRFSEISRHKYVNIKIYKNIICEYRNIYNREFYSQPISVGWKNKFRDNISSK